jgi:dipeptidyl aminopeptidase/acylaminoacyl peptidase
MNIAGASQEDKLIAMSIDTPVGIGFEYRVLEIPASGNLHLVGFTGIDKDDHVELYLVNNRPSINLTTGALADQTITGANSTIELLKVYPEAEEVQFVKTYAHEQIATPNNIAPLGDGSFYITNDHGSSKVGWRHKYSQFIGDGSIAYCDKDIKCKRVDIGYRFPNGLALGKDGLLYVPSTISGNLQVYSIEPNKDIKKIHKIKVPYPLDNVSPDANGDLFIAALPDLAASLPGFDDPLNAKAPAGVIRVHKDGEGQYTVEKVLEDAEGEVLPMTTTVVHDVKTGRLFLSSVISPYITVCEPKAIPAKPEGERKPVGDEL